MRPLGRVKYGEPEALDDRVISIWINDDMTHVVVENLAEGSTVRIPRHVAKEVGRVIVKGQNP